MNYSQKKLIFRLSAFAAILLSIIAFTPLVIPEGKHMPALFHLPYTLWSGLIVTFLFVLVTFIAVHFHPGNEEAKS